MSGLAAWTAQRRRGKMKKLRDSGPHSPCLPLEGPMVLSCWQGEPPMIRSMAPGSILARRACSRAPPSLKRCQTLPQVRSKKR
eukprot:6597799-Heterocapsa_arctica.AAC.1